MAFFAREDKRRASPPRKQGIHVGGAVRVPSPKMVITRDNFIDQSIASMQKDSTGADGGVLRFVNDTEKVRHPHRNANHRPDSDIFGPPVANKTPRMRIRTGVTDEELQKIWAEDERKVKAASHMESHPTLVDRMVADPVNPVVHSARAKDAVPPPRKQVNVLSGTTQERNRQANEPAGFSGMGKQCIAQGRQGRQCKAIEDFQAPELKLKPRVEGRRTRFPKDTFSFQQDDIQTY